jgi:hypothetical protein
MKSILCFWANVREAEGRSTESNTKDNGTKDSFILINFNYLKVSSKIALKEKCASSLQSRFMRNSSKRQAHNAFRSNRLLSVLP